MLSFSKEQKVVDISGTMIGGQPGEVPTVLFGTVFYGKQFRDMGPSALKKAEDLIQVQNEMSALTGNPAIVDVFIDSEGFEPRIDLAASASDGPISLDVPEASLWPSVLEHVAEAGLLDRTIVNSLNMGMDDGMLTALRKNTPAGAVLLAFDPRDMSADGRVAMIRDGGSLLEKGLLELAQDIGLTPILDTASTPFDHMACEALRAIPVFKNTFGLPTGCAIHNTVESWLWMKAFKKEPRDAYRYCDLSANVMPLTLGADLLIYGPMDLAPHAFPIAGMVDKFIAEGADDYFGVETADGHPRRVLY